MNLATREDGKDRFLAAFARLGTVTRAAEECGLSRQAHYNWLAEDENYALRFGQAKAEATDRILGEIRRRAIEGVDEPIFYKGQKVATVKRYSDVLLIFLAKGEMPDKFKDRNHVEMDANVAHSGNVHLYLPDNGTSGDDPSETD